MSAPRIPGQRPAIVLESLGWCVVRADVTLGERSDRVVVQMVRSSDGRRVTVDAEDFGDGRRRARIDVEYRVETHKTIGAGGCESGRGGVPVRRVEYRLLSRQQPSGPRAALRALAKYVSDNSDCTPALARAAVRALVS